MPSNAAGQSAIPNSGSIASSSGGWETKRGMVRGSAGRLGKTRAVRFVFQSRAGKGLPMEAFEAVVLIVLGSVTVVTTALAFRS